MIVHLAGALSTEEVFALEDRLIEAIEEAGAGELDGNEIALDGSEVVLYAYGPDADVLYEVMKPLLSALPPPRGSYAIKPYGPADDSKAREARVEL